MTTTVEKTVEVDVPVRTAYDQWTQFEEFPQFMGGVEQVEQLDDRTMRWVAQIAGVRRQWIATVLEQVPDRKVAWAATEGSTNAGAVSFTPLGADRTQVTLHLEFEPEGLVEKAGDALGVVERQAQSDLERFKTFIEGRGAETGAWRGSVDDQPDVGTPGVEDASASQGTSGSAGVSGAAVAAGAAAAVVGAAAVTALAGRSDTAKEAAQDAAHRATDGQDVVDILSSDHKEFLALVQEIRAATAPEAKRDLTDTLIAELVRHAVAEEMFVYPAMRKYLPDGDAAVEHDTSEHKDLERTMKQLEGLDVNDPQFTDALNRLETILVDHVQDEEGEQFPQLRAGIPQPELVQMGAKVEAAKKVAPTRPHPAAPNNQVFHKLVGPGVGLVDRLRDRLSGRTTS